MPNWEKNIFEKWNATKLNFFIYWVGGWKVYVKQERDINMKMMNQQECVERLCQDRRVKENWRACFFSFVATGQRRYKGGENSSIIFLFSINNKLKIILLSLPAFGCGERTLKNKPHFLCWWWCQRCLAVTVLGGTVFLNPTLLSQSPSPCQHLFHSGHKVCAFCVSLMAVLAFSQNRFTSNKPYLLDYNSCVSFGIYNIEAEAWILHFQTSTQSHN